MSTVETILEELRSLSSADRKKAESYIHNLKEERRRLLQDMLKRTHGTLAGEKGDCFEKAIEDCEHIDASSW